MRWLKEGNVFKVIHVFLFGYSNFAPNFSSEHKCKTATIADNSFYLLT